MRKVYGQSQSSACPFCGTVALSKNAQGVPMCAKHKHLDFPDVKCACGKWLDMRESKFGVFFTCMTCGAVSFSKMLEVNGEALIRAAHAPVKREVEKPKPKQSGPSDLTRLLQVQAKIKRGEMLTQDELDLL